MGHGCRFEARYSNDIHHFGFAPSKYLCAYKTVNDEWIITPKKPSKKATGNNEALNPVIYTLTDDYSGYRLARYFISKEKLGEHSIEFLKWSWENNVQHTPFRGIPKNLFIRKNLKNNTNLLDFCRRAVVKVNNFEVSGH
jgi:hypothetical protein